MQVETRTEILHEIVRRADLDAFTERVLDSFWDNPELQRAHPPREQVRAWVRWNVDLVVRWLLENRGPTESELESFREQARARAADGIPADLIPANFRRAARFAWAALLEGTREQDRPALLESAGVLLEYVDRVSRIFSDVYRTAAADPEEQAARALLERLATDEPPRADEHTFAETIGFDLERAVRPFVIVLPQASAQDHAALAARLRADGALAVSEGRRVVGLSTDRVAAISAIVPGAVVAAGAAAISHERGRAVDELRLVCEAALARGQAGVVRADDVLPEVLLLSAPSVARRIRLRVYGALEDGNVELARTLDALIEHDFERNATAAAIPVHRNTLRDRITRINELTGLDLGTARGQGLAWLAWLDRRTAI